MSQASPTEDACSRQETESVMHEFVPLDADGTRVDFSKVPIERVADFWDSRPCNYNHAKAGEHGTRRGWDRTEARKYFVEPHIPPFADFTAWKGKRVLEIGCGLGTETINFLRAGAHVTAVDVSPKSLAMAQQRATVYGLCKNARFVVADAERLHHVLGPKEWGSYDLVWSFGVLHHTPNPSAALEAAHTLLRPGTGQLRIMVYSRVSYKLFFLMRETGTWDFAQADALVARYSEAQSGCPVTYTYTASQARELLGPRFDVVSMSKAHIFAWDIDAYRQHRYVREACWAGVSAADFAELESELGWHLLIHAVKVDPSKGNRVQHHVCEKATIRSDGPQPQLTTKKKKKKQQKKKKKKKKKKKDKKGNKGKKDQKEPGKAQ